MLIAARNVRFGSLADICSAPTDVRFAPKSGHLQRTSRCPLSVKKQTSADVLYSINVRIGTETTFGDPHAVEILLAPNGVRDPPPITVLMMAATRPSQSNTGAPEAPWSMARRLSPSYISRRAVPASLPSVTYCTNRPLTKAWVLIWVGERYDTVFRYKRCHPNFDAPGCGNGRLQFEHGQFFRCHLPPNAGCGQKLTGYRRRP